MTKMCNVLGCDSKAEFYCIWIKKDGYKKWNDGICKFHNSHIPNSTYEECEDAQYYSIPIDDINQIKKITEYIDKLSVNRISDINRIKYRERFDLIERKLNKYATNVKDLVE